MILMKSALKNALKQTFVAYPSLKANRFYHGLMSFRDRKEATPDPSRSSRPDLVNDFLRDGVISLTNFATDAQVAACRLELEPQFDAARRAHAESTSTEPTFYHRLSNANELAPSSAFFYDSSLIWDIVRAYMSPKASSVRREAELRWDVIQNEVSPEDLFHFDSWHPNLKAFLYLTDVDESNGPFRYLVGSHKRASWRRKREMEWEAEGWGGSYGHYFPGEVKRLKREHGFEERVFTAKAGTLIIGDYSGLHRGTPIRSGGRRILLNQVFNIVDWRF